MNGFFHIDKSELLYNTNIYFVDFIQHSFTAVQYFFFFVDFLEYSFIARATIAQSVQRWATGWTLGALDFDSRRGLGIFLFTTASTTALEPTQTTIQWVPGALSLVVKRPGREADHSPPSSAELKE
jgi:hypothetical protein